MGFLPDTTKEQLERRANVGRWQIVRATFDTADTDVILQHQLTTPDPNQVSYQVLNCTAPAVIYHDGTPTRAPWGKGFVRLRARTVPVTADILLTVTAAPVGTTSIPQGSVTTPGTNADTLDGLDSTAFGRSNLSYVTTAAEGALSNESVLTAGTGVTITAGATINVTASASSLGGAADSEAFVVISNSGALSAERALAVGTGLTLTDGGANSNVTVALDRVFARKTGDETVTSSAALQDDDHLSVAIAASQTWEYRLHLVYDADTAGDFQFAFNVPASATGLFSYLGDDATTPTNLSSKASTDLTDTGTQTVGGNGAGTLVSLFITLLVVNSTNAGTVKLRWAQGTSSGTGTILKTNSYLIGSRVA